MARIPSFCTSAYRPAEIRHRVALCRFLKNSHVGLPKMIPDWAPWRLANVGDHCPFREPKSRPSNVAESMCKMVTQLLNVIGEDRPHNVHIGFYRLFLSPYIEHPGLIGQIIMPFPRASELNRAGTATIKITTRANSSPAFYPSSILSTVTSNIRFTLCSPIRVSLEPWRTEASLLSTQVRRTFW